MKRTKHGWKLVANRRRATMQVPWYLKMRCYSCAIGIIGPYFGRSPSNAIKSGDSGHVLLIFRLWAFSFRGSGRESAHSRYFTLFITSRTNVYDRVLGRTLGDERAPRWTPSIRPQCTVRILVLFESLFANCIHASDHRSVSEQESKALLTRSISYNPSGSRLKQKCVSSTLSGTPPIKLTIRRSPLPQLSLKSRIWTCILKKLSLHRLCIHGSLRSSRHQLNSLISSQVFTKSSTVTPVESMYPVDVRVCCAEYP
jgi:hypothetical protein